MSKSLRLLAITAGLIHGSAMAMIGLCPGTPPTGIIPCDTQCFGKAATNLGVEWAKVESKLQSEIGNNTQKWGESNNNYISFLMDYSQAKTTAQLERLSAWDGVTGKITASIDKCTLTFQRNVDTFMTSYSIMQKDLRKADEVKRNSEDRFSEVKPPHHNWLMSNAEAFHNENEGVANIDAVLMASNDNEFNLSQRERVVSLTVNEENIDYNSLLLKDELTQEELNHLSEHLMLLYVNNLDLNTTEGRRKKMKAQMALKVLLSSKTIVDDTKASQGLAKSISSFTNLVEAEDTLPMTSPHQLETAKVFSKGIYNSLLHEYMTNKRLKNALIATNIVK